jgi:hypothetical protein
LKAWKLAAPQRAIVVSMDSVERFRCDIACSNGFRNQAFPLTQIVQILFSKFMPLTVGSGNALDQDFHFFGNLPDWHSTGSLLIYPPLSR